MERNRVILVLACVLISLLAGCSSEQRSKDAPAKQLKAQAGGKIVYGSLYEPATLNPLSSDMVSAHEVSSLIFSSLVYMDDQGAWQPDLATVVPTLQNGGVSSDGKVVTYRLRNNVQWHDGKPFSASDVIFTWQLIMNPRNNIISRDGYDKISSIEAPDKNTLIIRFREHYPPFLALFSRILPKHLLEGADFAKTPFNRAPVGTGPFQFVEWRMAEEISLRANPNYHLGKPTIDSISYKIIPDINIMLTQIKAGVVDIVGSLDPSLIEQARAIDAFNVITNPTMIWEHLDMNLDNVKLKDPKVRQAISLAIDRQAIIAEAYRGAAAAAVSDQWPISWAARPDKSAAQRNLESAKELLAQAGWQKGGDGILAKDGVRLSLTMTTTSNNKPREIAARLLTQQLREAGIELLPRFVDIPAMFTDILPSRRFESALYAWYLGPDPDNSGLWHSRNIPGPSNAYKGKNYPGWRNPAADRLLDTGTQTIDTNSRREIYQQLQEITSQELPAIPLYFHSNIGIVKKTIMNYRPNASPSGNLWNAWQWAHGH